MANKLNKVLRTMFILLSFVLLSLLIGAPKTHCQTCALEFNDKIYNGYEALNILRTLASATVNRGILIMLCCQI